MAPHRLRSGWVCNFRLHIISPHVVKHHQAPLFEANQIIFMLSFWFYAADILGRSLYISIRSHLEIERSLRFISKRRAIVIFEVRCFFFPSAVVHRSLQLVIRIINLLFGSLQLISFNLFSIETSYRESYIYIYIYRIRVQTDFIAQPDSTPFGRMGDGWHFDGFGQSLHASPRLDCCLWKYMKRIWNASSGRQIGSCGWTDEV